MRVLGIDVGTSSMKAVCLGVGEPIILARTSRGGAPEDMLHTLSALLKDLAARVELSSIGSLGLSGQCGSWLVEEEGAPTRFVNWFAPGREEALARVCGAFSQEEFQRMIGMPHPPLTSYPVPSFLYLRAQGAIGSAGLFLQPKDYLMRALTGRALSDPGSWRGLYHAREGRYSEDLLRFAGIQADQLPEIAPCAPLSARGAALTGLMQGTPVYTGLNDFYAALLGMGAREGDWFDVTGTSEHFGLLTRSPACLSQIASPFQDTTAHYGVTSSSGVSIAWARREFGPAEPEFNPRAPVFAPYLRGERSPMFDSSARGMFFGINEHTTQAQLRYAVYEGVAFSLRQIGEELGEGPRSQVLCSGGSSVSAAYNRIKASVLGCPVLSQTPSCASALGAAACAGGQWHTGHALYAPDPALAEILDERYSIYRRLYAAWRDIAQETRAAELFC